MTRIRTCELFFDRGQGQGHEIGPRGQGQGLSSRTTTLGYSEEWLTCSHYQ